LGIATVTVFTEGDVTFDDPVAGHGTIGYGGLEWARAGLGMWHGKELSAGSSPVVQGFQLWIALSPELEPRPVVSWVGPPFCPARSKHVSQCAEETSHVLQDIDLADP
jgi:hypothetical protein